MTHGDIFNVSLLLSLEHNFTYTPLGIIGGLLWVIGGTAGIFAVRNAGLAISVGLWSAIMVLISFFWGIFIFDEKVKSKIETCFAVGLLTVGMAVMSYSSSQSPLTLQTHIESEQHHNNMKCYTEVELVMPTADRNYDNQCIMRRVESAEALKLPSSDDDDKSDATKKLITGEPITPRSLEGSINCLGIDCSRRKVGICAAIFNGIFAGSSFVPIHYVSEEAKGLSYVISFAIGATLSTTLLWAIRYLFLVNKSKSFFIGYQQLPSFHLRVMAVPGCTAGVLWSIGNFGNILAVTYLGQGVGISLGQASLITSGLWGIFWYKEIREMWKIILWFSAAILTGFSIYCLCYQKVV